MVPVLVGLGTNLGDRLQYLQRGVDALAQEVSIQAISGVVESPAMYLSDQPAFLNAILLAHTDLGPRGLLAKLKGIEAKIGRIARERYGPREIDLDLIAYGSLAYCYEVDGQVQIQVPHPRTPERAFVLKPLVEISPQFNLPGLGKASVLLDNLGVSADEVRLLPDAVLSLYRL